MNTTTTEKKDYELAREELAAAFAALNYSAHVSKPTLATDKSDPAHPWHHRAYTITFKYKSPGPSDEICLVYKMGMAHDKSPDPAEVLACYCREWIDAQTTFEDWADSFGYDKYSRKAKRIFNQCRRALPYGFLSIETRRSLAELFARL